MMRLLADAPADQRKMMVKSRIEMFLSSDETHRRAGMKDMVLALSRLSPDQRKRLVSTRSLVIAELPPDKRDTVMASRVALAMELPAEVHKADMQAVMETLPEIPENLRQSFVDSMKKAMEAAGVPAPM
jgi:hypothetical protein